MKQSRAAGYILAITVVGALAVTVGAKEFRMLGGKARRPSATIGIGAVFAPSLGGIDYKGREIANPLRPGDRALVVFMVHANELDHDLHYWSVVSAALAKDKIDAEGYCDGDKCIERMMGRAGETSFPLIAYGQAMPMRRLLQFDRNGEAAVLVHGNRVLSLPGWQKTAPTDLIAEVKAVLR